MSETKWNLNSVLIQLSAAVVQEIQQVVCVTEPEVAPGVKCFVHLGRKVQNKCSPFTVICMLTAKNHIHCDSHQSVLTRGLYT